jgi:hypothetical protein
MIPGVICILSQLLFYSDKLIILCNPIGAAGTTGFYLSTI